MRVVDVHPNAAVARLASLAVHFCVSSPAPSAVRPTPGQIFSVAYANYMKGDVARAEFLIEQTIALSAEPKESWYQLYYQILLDLKKFDSAERVLIGMISRQPASVTFWRMLVAHYLQLEESSDALASFMVAYNNNLIDRESGLE